MSIADQSLAKRVQGVSQQAIDEGRIVGSVVLVARHGRVVYANASGYADREQKKPMSA
jgi:CubicO group peptidase (beta-lactamase class C family)